MKERGKPEIISAILMLLGAIEGGPLRAELLETPYRVQKALEEMLDGYGTDIDDIIKVFDGEGKDQIIIVKDIHAWSYCEHHLLPFSIKVAVGYLPKERVLGVSKIERLVLAFAHRLQLQERITEQVARTLMNKLQPYGVAVVAEGEHLCMRCRGIKSKDSKVVTSIMLGAFREDATLRLEFLSLLGK